MRFGLVGTSTLGLRVALFSLAYNVLHVHYLISGSVVYLATIAGHFLLSRHFTFRTNSALTVAQAMKYALVLVFNYGLSMVCLWLCTGVLGLAPQIGIVAGALLTALTSYTLMKHQVFV